jgi:hypothetical protein
MLLIIPLVLNHYLTVHPRSYEVPVKALLSSSSTNTLTIVIQPAIPTAMQRAKSYPFAVPGVQVRRVQRGMV